MTRPATRSTCPRYHSGRQATRRGNQVPLGTIRVSEICHGNHRMAESRPGPSGAVCDRESKTVVARHIDRGQTRSNEERARWPRDLLHRDHMPSSRCPSAQPSPAIPRDNQRELVMNTIRHYPDVDRPSAAVPGTILRRRRQSWLRRRGFPAAGRSSTAAIAAQLPIPAISILGRYWSSLRRRLTDERSCAKH